MHFTISQNDSSAFKGSSYLTAPVVFVGSVVEGWGKKIIYELIGISFFRRCPVFDFLYLKKAFTVRTLESVMLT